MQTALTESTRSKIFQRAGFFRTAFQVVEASNVEINLAGNSNEGLDIKVE
jgi:hypothetical protein